MLELDNDNHLNNDKENDDNLPPTNDVIPTQISKSVKFSDTIETIDNRHKKRRRKKKSKIIPNTASTTQSEPSTAIDTSIQTKVSTVTQPSVALDKVIQSDIHNNTQTEIKEIDGKLGKRQRKKPDFYQAGVSRK
jgi:hypothetical protein